MTVVLTALIAMNVVSCRKDFNKFVNSMFNEEKAGNDEVETLFETLTKSMVGINISEAVESFCRD